MKCLITLGLIGLLQSCASHGPVAADCESRLTPINKVDASVRAAVAGKTDSPVPEAGHGN